MSKIVVFVVRLPTLKLFMNINVYNYDMQLSINIYMVKDIIKL